MFKRGLTLLLALALAPERGPAADDGAARIARLVGQLGDPRYALREQAERALRDAGVPALAALRRAAEASPDCEVRRRAGRLVREVGQRAESARLLAPAPLRLVYKDTPVPEALADITRRTGVPFRLEGSREPPAGRRVTLDTGETTFWEALERFCAKAGLVEVEPAWAPRPREFSSGSVVIIRGRARGFAPTPSDILRPGDEALPPAVVLADGKPSALPTHHAGAVRVRALPPDAGAKGEEKKPGEILFALDAKAGPHLVWGRTLAVRVRHAVDDQGQRLRQLSGPLEEEARAETGGTRVFINQVPLGLRSNEPEAGQAHVPVRLEAAARPSKTLRELSGTIVALVRTGPETLAVVDGVLKSEGRTVAIAQGGFVKVLEVARADDGRYRLRLQVEAPPTQVDDGTALDAGLTAIVDGQRVGPREEPLSARNFALLDARGRPLEAVRAVDTGVRAGTARELELVYEPATGQALPARFVYSGRRGAVVEVPFTLTNVPLP